MSGKALNWLKRPTFRRAGATNTLAAQTRKLGNILQKFYGKDTRKEAGIKVLGIAISFPVFNYLMWALTGVTVIIVGLLKEFGFGYWAIFFILWPGNLLLCWLILWLYNKTGVDFTLAETYRRSTDEGVKRSWLAGIALEMWFFISLIFWAGAAQFTIYFRGKYRSRLAEVVAFLAVSAAQMLFWVYVFYLGYESATDLFFH